MITYVPTSGASVCAALSDALWSLTQPKAIRSPLDTQRMFDSITCTDGSVWLEVDTTTQS